MVKLAGAKARLEVNCKQNIPFSYEPSWQGLALNPQQFAKQYWNAFSKAVQVVEVQCRINKGDYRTVITLRDVVQLRLNIRRCTNRECERFGESLSSRTRESVGITAA